MFEIKNYKAYIESSKPKVVMLMIFTSFIGMLLANPLELNLEILILLSKKYCAKSGILKIKRNLSKNSYF